VTVDAAVVGRKTASVANKHHVPNASGELSGCVAKEELLLRARVYAGGGAVGDKAARCVTGSAAAVIPEGVLILYSDQKGASIGGKMPDNNDARQGALVQVEHAVHDDAA
jgi:hypothetical protein